MIEDPSSVSEDEDRTRTIGAILNDLHEAKLLREGDDWYAIFETSP